VQVVDWTKDVIKSGGEWISSTEIESIAVAHPAVQEAAAIARQCKRSGERPLLVAVLSCNHQAAPLDLDPCTNAALLVIEGRELPSYKGKNITQVA
jgi:acyl-CoA synthetase (AMP-forming)/AMP-acid ligase II